MERDLNYKGGFWIVVAPTVLTAILLAFAASQSDAGTTLLPPPRQEAPRGGAPEYAESRFGKPPSSAIPGLGGRRHFKAIEEPEDDGAGGAGRSPASEGPAGASVLNPLPSDVENEAAIRRKGVQEVAVIAGDLGFFPKALFVARDIPVRLFVTGASKQSLCLMMDSFQVRKQIRSQKIEEITFTPSTPGKYRYYCPVNGAEGTLVVKELTGAANP